MDLLQFPHTAPHTLDIVLFACASQGAAVSQAVALDDPRKLFRSGNRVV